MINFEVILKAGTYNIYLKKLEILLPYDISCYNNALKPNTTLNNNFLANRFSIILCLIRQQLTKNRKKNNSN